MRSEPQRLDRSPHPRPRVPAGSTCPQRVAAGFTLIEILLAVVVFGIVLVAMHGVFYGALRLRNRTTSSLDAALPLHQTFAIMRDDLANVVAPDGVLAGAFQSTSSGGGMTPATTLQFSTAVGHLDDASRWAEIQRVTYVLAPSTNNTPGLDLHRCIIRNLLPVLEEQVEAQWLMSGVESLVFSFHDGTTWKESWDSTLEETPLPRAIRVQLQLIPDPKSQRPQRGHSPFELVVPLLLEGRANATVQTNGGGA